MASYFPKDVKPLYPPAPKEQPKGCDKVKPKKECIECKNECKEPERGWVSRVQRYGCWCGGDVAPAKTPKDVEHDIPEVKDKAAWDAYTQKHNMPLPKDAVDECCRMHDLDLAHLRKTGGSHLNNESVDPRAKAINLSLAECFGKNKNNPDVDCSGQSFAWRGEKMMNHIAETSNTPATVMGDPMTGFGAAGADGAMTGANGAIMP